MSRPAAYAIIMAGGWGEQTMASQQPHEGPNPP